MGPWWFNAAADRWRCPPPGADAYTFHVQLPGYHPSALIEAPALADELGVARVLVKDESSRLELPAFKILGASWAVARVVSARAGSPSGLDLAGLRELARAHPTTLVTATDGNHGRAVARMASLLGLASQVFVPEVMSGTAAAAIEAEGACVTRLPGGYDAAVAHAASYAAARPTTELVQDVAWPGYERVPGWIVDGYATMLIEADAQLAEAGLTGDLDLVAVPVGVGSLAQAVVAHYRSRPGRPTAVLSVEPDTAACLLASLSADQPTSVSTESTVMAGLNCGSVSSAAWPYLRGGVTAAVSVSDGEAEQAVADLADLGVDSGPSGAATLAGLRSAIGPPQQERRRQLGITDESVVMLLSTEGRGRQR